MRPRFHADARREFRRVVDHFAEIDSRVARRFVVAMRETVARALETPGGGALWPGVPHELDVRRRRVPGFKYLSFAYLVADETLWIVAVVHDRQLPGYWMERLRDLPEP